MKKFFLPLLFIFLVDNIVQAQDDSKIATYFEQCLNGEYAKPTTHTFSIKQLKAKREQVWKAWKIANTKVNALKLPNILTLGSHSYSWHLPDSLEPNATMQYYYGNKGEIPTNGAPFFLYLHGSGPKEQEWATGLALANRFNDSPSIYFIPQIPNQGEWYRWWQRSKQYAWDNLLRNLFLNDSINPNQLYVFGISEGGYGSQRLASYYADYWAAAGPMAGGEPLKNAPIENLENIGFTFHTGANDTGFYRNTLTRYTSEALDSIERLYPKGFRHKVELVPNRQHFIDYSVTTPWLLHFKRNPYPLHFIWEDFEMDGQHRSGFYNLRVLKRPDKELRTRYDVDINDNKVNIVVENVAYTTIQRDSVFGIEMKFHRHYTTAHGGKFIVYLNEHLVDLTRPVTISVNGKKIFHKKATLDIKHLQESLKTFYDKERIYPAAFEIDY